MENDEQRTKREGCEEALSRFFTSPSKASTRIALVIEVLQTFALPLGYDALSVTPTGFEPMLSP